MKEGKNTILRSKSKTFLMFCFCFIFGAGLFSAIAPEKYLTVILLVIIILFFILLSFIILFWHQRNFILILFCFFFFLIGSMRYLISIPENTPDNLRYYNGQKVEITGQVSQEPEVGIMDVKYVVNVNIIDRQNFVSDKVLIKLPLYPQYNYGDQLQMTCNLQEPQNTMDSSFNYKQYLARQDVWSVCQWPSDIIAIDVWTGLDLSIHARFMKQILNLKSKISSQIDKLWPEPKSSLMAGLLYGARSGLPQELKENFSSTGVTHIIAISGFNISIIALVLSTLLISIGLYRQQAFWVSVVCIILFVIFTGASASVVRAGIMGVIVLIAQQLGRLSRIGNVLAITAALMLLFNPYVLIWDAGFQLSFLATMGLVYLSPIVNELGRDRSRPVPMTRNIVAKQIFEPIRETFIQTISAIIATLPLILFQFGRLSIVAPIVNVLVLWTIPWLMLFGFLAVIAGFIFFPLGQIIAWLGGLGMDYVIMIVNWFGKQSWSAIDLKIPWWGMVGAYIILLWLVIKKRKSKVL